MRNQPSEQSKDNRYNYSHPTTPSTEIRFISRQLSDDSNDSYRINRKADPKFENHFDYIPSTKNNPRYLTNEYEKPSLPYYVVPVLYVPQKVLSSDEIRNATSFQRKQTSSSLPRSYQQTRNEDDVDETSCTTSENKRTTCPSRTRSETEEELVNHVNLDKAYTGYINKSYTYSSTSVIDENIPSNYIDYGNDKLYVAPLEYGNSTPYENNSAGNNVQHYDQFLQKHQPGTSSPCTGEKPPLKTNVFLKWNHDCNSYEIVEETVVINQDKLNATNNIIVTQKREQTTSRCDSSNKNDQRSCKNEAPTKCNVDNEPHYLAIERPPSQEDESGNYETAVDESKFTSYDKNTCEVYAGFASSEGKSHSVSYHSQDPKKQRAGENNTLNAMRAGKNIDNENDFRKSAVDEPKFKYDDSIDDTFSDQNEERASQSRSRSSRIPDHKNKQQIHMTDKTGNGTHSFSIKDDHRSLQHDRTDHYDTAIDESYPKTYTSPYRENTNKLSRKNQIRDQDYDNKHSRCPLFFGGTGNNRTPYRDKAQHYDDVDSYASFSPIERRVYNKNHGGSIYSHAHSYRGADPMHHQHMYNNKAQKTHHYREEHHKTPHMIKPGHYKTPIHQSRFKHHDDADGYGGYASAGQIKKSRANEDHLGHRHPNSYPNSYNMKEHSKRSDSFSNDSEDRYTHNAYREYQHDADSTLGCKKAPKHNVSGKHDLLSATTVTKALEHIPALTVGMVSGGGRNPKASQTTFDDSGTVNTYDTNNGLLSSSKSSQTIDSKDTVIATGTQTDRTMRAFATRPPSYLNENEDGELRNDKTKHREASPSPTRGKKYQTQSKYSSDAKKFTVTKNVEVSPRSSYNQTTPPKSPKFKKRKIGQSAPSSNYQ